MKTFPISSTNFTKLYFQEAEYSEEQNILIQKIKEGLDNKYVGKQTYLEKIEENGWDLVIKKGATDNQIGIDPIYKKGLFGKKYVVPKKEGLPPFFRFKSSDMNNEEFDPNYILRWTIDQRSINKMVKASLYMLSVLVAATLLVLTLLSCKPREARNAVKPAIERINNNAKTIACASKTLNFTV